MKKYRIIQLLTGVHYIHHIRYSFGWKLPFIKIAYFKNYGWQKTDIKSVINPPYHNCTLSGIY